MKTIIGFEEHGHSEIYVIKEKYMLFKLARYRAKNI